MSINHEKRIKECEEEAFDKEIIVVESVGYVRVSDVDDDDGWDNEKYHPRNVFYQVHTTCFTNFLRHRVILFMVFIFKGWRVHFSVRDLVLAQAKAPLEPGNLQGDAELALGESFVTHKAAISHFSRQSLCFVSRFDSLAYVVFAVSSLSFHNETSHERENGVNTNSNNLHRVL